VRVATSLGVASDRASPEVETPAVGRDESGRPLKKAMPRRQMNAADLQATIDYLKTLSAR
jgi:hypothetical protein